MDHDELALLAWLTGVNHDLGRYIVRRMEGERGTTEFTRPLAEVERELAARLADAARALHAAAEASRDGVVDAAPGVEHQRGAPAHPTLPAAVGPATLLSGPVPAVAAGGPHRHRDRGRSHG